MIFRLTWRIRCLRHQSTQTVGRTATWCDLWSMRSTWRKDHADMWIIDFGADMPKKKPHCTRCRSSMSASMCYRAMQNRRAHFRGRGGCMHGPGLRCARPDGRRHDTSQHRVSAKHRVFVWVTAEVLARRRTDRFRPRRRLLLRRPALPHPRNLGAAHGHATPRGRERLPLHPHHHLRDLPLPLAARPGAGGRSARAGHRRRGSRSGGEARRVAQPDRRIGRRTASSAPSPTSTTRGRPGSTWRTGRSTRPCSPRTAGPKT